MESIYYLALTRSFRSKNDKNVTKYEENYFNINGIIHTESNRNFSVLISYSAQEKKQVYLNKKKIDKFSSFVGNIPCVLLTLEDLKLTMGLPSNRRNFMDILLSQISPVYLQNLKTYKKVVQQRNKLISDSYSGIDINQLKAWDMQLVEYGSKLILERLKYLEFMNQNISRYYNIFSKEEEYIEVKYNSTLNNDLNISTTLNNISEYFSDKLNKVRKLEIDKKTSIIGPHRDDLEFLKNNKSFREYGSQGENKTLIIVLKILEWLYLKNQKERKPLLLLDDIFGELDRSRIQGLLTFLDGIGQSFITTTLKDIFSDISEKHDLYLENTQIAYA